MLHKTKFFSFLEYYQAHLKLLMQQQMGLGDQLTTWARYSLALYLDWESQEKEDQFHQDSADSQLKGSIKATWLQMGNLFPWLTASLFHLSIFHLQCFHHFPCQLEYSVPKRVEIRSKRQTLNVHSHLLERLYEREHFQKL